MTIDGEGFAGLALRLRGRTGLTQRDIAAALDVHVRSVQLWEAAASHPNVTRLQGLIRVFLEAGAFGDGTEREEAEALWLSAMTESSRLVTGFDDDWFTRLVKGRKVQVRTLAPPHLSSLRGGGRQHWSGAPDTSGFLSRRAELDTLRRWVVDDACRVVAVLGMGGVGKTLLAARAARDLDVYFENVYWRSLRNAPNFGELLSGIVSFLAPHDSTLSANDDTRCDRLVELLGESPTLLIFDSVETLLQPGQRTGGYLPGYAAYGELVQRLAETPHRSCLLLTSREAPLELGALKGCASATRTLHLDGLAAGDVRMLLHDKGLDGTEADWTALVRRYAGNGLALKLIGETVHEVFGGDIKAFMDDVEQSQSGLSGGVRQLLDSQIRRLSDAELRAIRRLAVEREPMTFAELARELEPGVSRADTREAVEALLRRSLLERHEPGPTFTLQSVVLEFVTEQIVAEAADDLARGGLETLRTEPLSNAAAKDHIRRSQERLIALPVLEQLIALTGSRMEAEARIVECLRKLRTQPREMQAYGPGNAVNLLRLSKGDLSQLDLSDLSIRRAYLADVEVRDTSLAGSHLTDCVLAQAFHHAAVVLSPDGAHLLAGTTGGEVCLWRPADRTLLLSLPSHAGMVWRLAMAPEQDLIASASEDGTVKLWEASSGRELATLRGHTDSVHGVALGGDGYVATCSQDGTVRLWRSTGEPLRTLQSPAGGVLSVALSLDTRVVVAGTEGGVVTFWDVASGRLLESHSVHAGPVPGLAVSHDGRLLASASLDGTVGVWDLPARRLRRTLEGHTAGVWNVSLSADGRLAASAGQDGSVRLWTTADGKPTGLLTGHTGDVWDVSLSADGKIVASTGHEGSIRLSDCSTGQLLTSLHGYTTAVWDVALSGDGTRVASASQDGTVSVWDTSSGDLHCRLIGQTAGVAGVVLDHEGHVLATAGHDGTVKIWDISTAAGRLRTTLRGHAARAVWSVALSADGRTLTSGSFDGTVKLWDAEHGELLATLDGHTCGVRSVAMTDNVIVSGSQDGSLHVWQRDGLRPFAAFVGHAGSVQSVATDAHGRLAVSGGFDGLVKVWDIESGRCLRSMAGHKGGVLRVAMSARGDCVVSGGFDRTVNVWDVPSGTLRGTLVGHRAAVRGLSLDAEGASLASGSVDGTTRLWDVAHCRCVCSLQVDRPYERMDVTALTGLSSAHRASLASLGAVDRSLHVSSDV
jgi:WD40 repeat protein